MSLKSPFFSFWNLFNFVLKASGSPSQSGQAPMHGLEEAPPCLVYFGQCAGTRCHSWDQLPPTHRCRHSKLRLHFSACTLYFWRLCKILLTTRPLPTYSKPFVALQRAGCVLFVENFGVFVSSAISSVPAIFWYLYSWCWFLIRTHHSREYCQDEINQR